MKSKVVTGIMLILLLIGMLILTFNIQPLKASGTIYIRANGSVDPPTAPISSVDNVTYMFTDNINESIVVQRNNTIVDGNGYTLQGPGLGYGFHLEFGINNVTIERTNIRKFTAGIRLYMDVSFNNVIENNITDNTRGILAEWSCNNNNFSKNHITNNLDGIRLDGSMFNIISGNNITDNERVGIGLLRSSNNTISENNITNNQHGFLLDESSNNTISGNNITNLFGIYLIESSNNTGISGNVMANNNRGICIVDSSNNDIFGNKMTNNERGIIIVRSSNSTISGNDITDNEEGIHLYESSNNKFYHNNITDNTQPVYIGTSGYPNFWNEGIEGNYWSDYEERYPNAREIDGSGIWGTPYVIDENNQDNYPLMYAWGASPPSDTTPHTISILSPENKTYPVNDVPLTFTVSESTSWIGYSLDGQANVTITGNTTLSGLSEGSHSLIVYAKDVSVYTGNTGASEIIYFSIETAQPFPIEIVAAIGIIVVVGAVVFVYFMHAYREREDQNQFAQNPYER